MIRIVTIEREYGSGGAEIAKSVAARLGWKLWDQSLTNEIARLMECDCRAVEEREEKRDPLYLPPAPRLHARQPRRKLERPAAENRGHRLHPGGRRARGEKRRERGQLRHRGTRLRLLSARSSRCLSRFHLRAV